jgi:hypothetical protein
MTTIRELLESNELLHNFFHGQNHDHEVRLAVNPGVVEVVAEEPKTEEVHDEYKEEETHG